jgi:hypothetical protein
MANGRARITVEAKGACTVGIAADEVEAGFVAVRG